MAHGPDDLAWVYGAAVPPESDPETSPQGRPTWRVAFDPTYGPFFWTNWISNIGNWFQNVAAGVVVFRLTGSNTFVGLVSVGQFAASLVLSPFAGSLSDRADRRLVLLGGQATAAAGAMALAVWVLLVGVEGLPGVWPVLITAGVIGLGFSFAIAALNALTPALVPEEDLASAIALNSASFTLARAFGPALAGVVVATLGATVAFGANALTFLPLLVVLMVIRPRHVERPAGDRSVRAGFRYVRSRADLGLLLAATLAVGVAGDPVNTLSPAYAELFSRSEAFVGLQVALFGSGSAVGSLIVGRLHNRLGLLRTARVAMGLLGAGLVATALAPTGDVVLVTWFVTGIGFVFGVTSTNASLQGRIDEDMRGRVMAFWGAAFLGSRPIAAIMDGAVADLISPRAGVLAAGIPLVAGWWFVTRVLRNHGENA